MEAISNLTSIKKVAELRYESLKQEFVYLRSVLSSVDYAMETIDKNDENMEKVLNNVTASISDHINGEFQAFESISEEWLKKLFSFLLENPTDDGYLYPNSLLEVILWYKELNDETKNYINSLRVF